MQITQSLQKINHLPGEVYSYSKYYNRKSGCGIYIYGMKMFGRFSVLSILGVFSLSLGLYSCGGDSSSGADPEILSSSAETGLSSGEVVKNSSSSASGEKPSSSSGGAVAVSSSSKASETTSSDEVLNDPKNLVNGTCGPVSSEIKKGELATWKFYRSAGEVYDQILAPFVWAFEGASTTSLQGNGLQEVNVRYAEAGSFQAYLNVDGNEVACSPLQVQGIPIVVNSCTPDKLTAKAGETITWTVSAESESPITGYSWTSAYGDMSGSGESATLAATSAMHKKSVAATVTVSNADNSAVNYSCDPVTVIDPESVDLVLELGDVNDSKYSETLRPTLPDSIFIPAQTATTVQIPAGAKSGCTVGCVPRVGADWNNMKVYWDSDTELSSFAYFSPAGCAPGKKYTVTTTVMTLCVAQ